MTKRIFKQALIILLLAGSFSSCSEQADNTPFPEPIAISFTEYSLCNDFYHLCRCKDMNEDEKTKIMIINSQKEMENFIIPQNSDTNCPIFSGIDFSKYTLLLVQGWAPSFCFYTSPEDYPSLSLPKLQQFSLKNFVLNIEMRASNNGSNRQWNRAFIVDKINQKSIVELEVNIQLEDKLTFTHDESASIAGKWRLVKEEMSGMGCPPHLITDFSQYNIVYEFKPDGVLTITSNTDYYRGLKVGDHSYSFVETSDFYGTAYWLETDDLSRARYFISSEQLVIDYTYMDYDAFHFVKIH